MLAAVATPHAALLLLLLCSLATAAATAPATALVELPTSPAVGLNWQAWGQRVRNFTEEFEYFLMPGEEPFYTEDHNELRVFTRTLILGVGGFSEEIERVLIEHKDNTTNPWDLHLLSNLLDLYAGLHLYATARLTETYREIERHVKSFRGGWRDTHGYYFLAPGLRRHLARHRNNTHAFLSHVLSPAPGSIAALASIYRPRRHRRLDNLLAALNIQPPIMKINSSGYYIRPAWNPNSCLQVLITGSEEDNIFPVVIQKPRLTQITTVDDYEPVLTLLEEGKEGTTHMADEQQWQRENGNVTDGSEGYIKHQNCLAFRFLSVGGEGGAAYVLEAAVGGTPHHLSLRPRPHRDAVLVPRKAQAGPAATALLPLRVSGDRTLLLHRNRRGAFFVTGSAEAQTEGKTGMLTQEGKGEDDEETEHEKWKEEAEEHQEEGKEESSEKQDVTENPLMEEKEVEYTKHNISEGIDDINIISKEKVQFIRSTSSKYTKLNLPAISDGEKVMYRSYYKGVNDHWILEEIT